MGGGASRLQPCHGWHVVGKHTKTPDLPKPLGQLIQVNRTAPVEVSALKGSVPVPSSTRLAGERVIRCAISTARLYVYHIASLREGAGIRASVMKQVPPRVYPRVLEDRSGAD